MPATIRDIAHRAGVAVGTVSKYLNGQTVRVENRARIESAIHDLDYSVNPAARNLKTRRSMTVGVLITKFTDVFNAEIVSAIERNLGEHGYGIIVCDYGNDAEQYDRKLEFLASKRVDGIITVPGTAVQSQALGRVQARIPTVCFDYRQKGAPTDAVLTDNVGAIYAATSEIIDRGHRRIGILVNDRREDMTSEERLLGYQSALAAYFLPVEPDLIRCGNYTMEGGYRAMNELLDMPVPPTCVIVTNYYMTIGAYMALTNRKLRIPGDMSFLGFDRIIMADLIEPKLSIVEQPMQEIADSVTELLLERMSGKRSGPPVIRRLPTSIAWTDSVATLAP